MTRLVVRFAKKHLEVVGTNKYVFQCVPIASIESVVEAKKNVILNTCDCELAVERI